MGLAQKTFGEIITFTRASAATRINHLGQLETVGNNVPRIDYDPVTLECIGLLTEGQRTRINTISLSPTNSEVIAVTAQAYTLSFYGTGSVSITGAHSQNVVGTGIFPSRTVYTFTPTAGSVTLSYSGDCADVQLEAGVFASSIIRGEGAQVTRSADACRINTLWPWFSTAAGTLYTNFIVMGEDGSTGSISAAGFGTSDPNQWLSFATVDQRQNIGLIAPYGFAFNPQYYNVSGQNLRIAQSFAGVTAKAAAVNGLAATPGLDISGSFTLAALTGLGLMSKGRTGFPGFGAMFGHLKELKYFPRELSTAQLQALTA